MDNKVHRLTEEEKAAKRKKPLFSNYDIAAIDLIIETLKVNSITVEINCSDTNTIIDTVRANKLAIKLLEKIQNKIYVQSGESRVSKMSIDECKSLLGVDNNDDKH